jgi:NAD+ synthase (glutamine-hydrolysing)
LSFGIDLAVEATISIIKAILKLTPRFIGFGGSQTEHFALQNLQARLRMVIGYFVAQLAPVTIRCGGPVLVLSTANSSEWYVYSFDLIHIYFRSGLV